MQRNMHDSRSLGLGFWMESGFQLSQLLTERLILRGESDWKAQGEGQQVPLGHSRLKGSEWEMQGKLLWRGLVI